MSDRGERHHGEIGWAEDFYGVWHRMANGDWAKGVGPADPVACCACHIDSVHFSSFNPSELPDEWAIICGEPIIDQWQTTACGFCYVAAGVRCITASGGERRVSHKRRRYVVQPTA